MAERVNEEMSKIRNLPCATILEAPCAPMCKKRSHVSLQRGLRAVKQIYFNRATERLYDGNIWNTKHTCPTGTILEPPA